MVWPFLVSRDLDPGLMQAMEGEHAAMKEALADASRAIDEVSATRRRRRRTARPTPCRCSSVVINDHLEHEETDVEPLIARFEDDPEWKAVAKKLRPAAPSTPGARWPGWRTGRGSRSARRCGRRSRRRWCVVSLLFGRRYAREVAPTWR